VLADQRFPPVHCYLFSGTDRVAVRWLEIGPPLEVNGKSVESAELQNGDRITLGPFEFVIYIRTAYRIVGGDTGDESEYGETPVELERGRQAVFNLLNEVRRELLMPTITAIETRSA
jgi:hypothetical protein